ncbi:MAG: bifunctional serine/threonine-protein kinase/formylglycine-generating enzyme family protein [Prochloraceae cyanobacterium]|nr:bifunctional serine/threonine-protein kinase/formylglycine-generating enzyme family protein [Prochloraceae cyanobacterium]
MNIDIVSDRFQIIKKIGGGTFSETYLAEDLQQFDHRCVIKRLRPVVGSPETFEKIKNLFQREAKVLYQLGRYHDQIPTLIAYFESYRQLYLVQEFVEGHHLSYELTPGKQLPESEAIAILENILEPLAFLHQRQVIHRDIKPSNLIRRTSDGKIVLIDFGAIKEIAITQLIDISGKTRVGTIIGTPGYMPSEQGQGKPKLASDVYALGIIGIQAVTGLVPQQIEEHPETGELVWQHRASISPEFSFVLEKMVHYFYKKRYPSAIEVLKALQELKNNRSSITQKDLALATEIKYYSPPEETTNDNNSIFEVTSQVQQEKNIDRTFTPTTSNSFLTDKSRLNTSRKARINLIQEDITPRPNLMKRRQWIKWVALSSAGLSVAVVGPNVFNYFYFNYLFKPEISSDFPSFPAYVKKEKFNFEVISVNIRGQEIQRKYKQSQYFVEHLGDGISLEMIPIPSGTFVMGVPITEKVATYSQQLQHQVRVPPFFMGKYQVTQSVWRAVANLPLIDSYLDPYPSRFKSDNLPVEGVNWYDAIEFCKRLSKKTGRQYRLPSEAEWEYACRAGTTTPFNFGKTIRSDFANYNGRRVYAKEPRGKYRKRTTPVGSFFPNSFGLYDMHGNVWEWCADFWHNNYLGAPTDGSAWYVGGDSNNSPMRGGSWLDSPRFCRSGYRSRKVRILRNYLFGFRVVCDVAPT